MGEGMGISSASWFPVLTALVGFVTASISDWLRDRRASAREREAAEANRTREREGREAARREQRFERRAAFQRQTLLDLQEAVQKLVRTTGEMKHHDTMAVRAGGEWGKQLLGEDLNNRSHLTNVQTTMLGVRVRDESVRNLLRELREECMHSQLAGSEAEAERALVKAASIFEKLNERIGELLRKLDDDEEATG